jgi:hypothetical protein
MFTEDGLHSAGVCAQVTWTPETAHNAAATTIDLMASP